MVASHQVGDLVRSFVRVPGSGSEKSAKVTFCDLARASTLAATVSIPQNLPPATDVITQTPSATKISGNQHQKITSLQVSLVNVPIKTIPVTLMGDICIHKVEVQKLKEENRILEKKLSLFKRLFRNRQRLNSVLRRLDEKKGTGGLKHNKI